MLRRIVARALIVFFLIELTTDGWAAGPDAGPADEAGENASGVAGILALAESEGL